LSGEPKAAEAKPRIASMSGRLPLRTLATSLLAIVLPLSLGCVKRHLQIHSFPEGAAVTVDHQPVGYTPLSVPFQYYGTREILLEKDGYKAIRVKHDVAGPWYLSPPWSLITEHFATREIRDIRRLEFQLEPLGQVNDQDLIDRGENLRGQVLQGTITPSLQRAQYSWDAP